MPKSSQGRKCKSSRISVCGFKSLGWDLEVWRVWEGELKEVTGFSGLGRRAEGTGFEFEAYLQGYLLPR